MEVTDEPTWLWPLAQSTKMFVAIFNLTIGQSFILVYYYEMPTSLLSWTKGKFECQCLNLQFHFSVEINFIFSSNFRVAGYPAHWIGTRAWSSWTLQPSREISTCHSWPVWPDLANYCTLGNFQNLWQQLFCPNRPHFLAIFKRVKIYHFCCEIIFGQLL